MKPIFRKSGRSSPKAGTSSTSADGRRRRLRQRQPVLFAPHRPAPAVRPADDGYPRHADATAILGAFKVTGKTRHGLSLGRAGQPDRPRPTPPSAWTANRAETVEPLTNYFMLRAQQDFNEGKTIFGAMVTAVNRDINDPALDFLHSRLHRGLDFYHSWKNRSYFVSPNSVFSLVNGSQEAILETQNSPCTISSARALDYLDLDPAAPRSAATGGNFEIGKSGNSN